MPAPSTPSTVLPLFRTHGVWKGIGIGLAAGILLTLGVSHCWPTRVSGEGQRRADSIGIFAGERFIIPADLCDVSHALAGMPDAPGPVCFRIKLPRLVDGDTIRVLWHGEEISVRLLGIDAPERNHPGYEQATSYLCDLLAGVDAIDLEFTTGQPRRDSLGRVLATVWHGETSINSEMLGIGYAAPHRKGGKRQAKQHSAIQIPRQ